MNFKIVEWVKSFQVNEWNEYNMECSNAWMNDQMNELNIWMNKQKRNKQLNVWISDRMNEWMGYKMSFWPKKK